MPIRIDSIAPRPSPISFARTARKPAPSSKPAAHRHDHERPHSGHSQFRQGEFSGALRRPRRASRSTSRRTRCRSATSRCSVCSISATSIGVEGHLFRTRTNELTIWASRIEFLAKCHLPLPEKWHGLTDVEIRYRQRYLDLIVNPEAREVFQVRSKVLAALREFLDARGYLEVETPMMQPIAGGRDGAAVPHASQRARCRSVSADCARAVSEAARRRRPRARVRDQRGTSATRASRRGTIPSSRCSSSIRPTATIRT